MFKGCIGSFSPLILSKKIINQDVRASVRKSQRIRNAWKSAYQCKKIVKNRYKIQNVTMGENKLLKMRRKKYEKNVTEKKNNGSKYLQKLTVRKFSPFPGTSLLHGQ